MHRKRFRGAWEQRIAIQKMERVKEGLLNFWLSFHLSHRQNTEIPILQSFLLPIPTKMLAIQARGISVSSVLFFQVVLVIYGLGNCRP